MLIFHAREPKTSSNQVEGECGKKHSYDTWIEVMVHWLSAFEPLPAIEEGLAVTLSHS